MYSRVASWVKYAVEAFDFEPNVSSTWNNINVTISNFLNNTWHQGALAGSTAGEAYSVSVGLRGKIFWTGICVLWSKW